MTRFGMGGWWYRLGVLVGAAIVAVGSNAGSLVVDPEELDGGLLSPGSSATKALLIENTGPNPVQFEFPGFSDPSFPGAELAISLDDELFDGFEFRAAADGPVSGTWTGFSASLTLSEATGATWTNDIAVLLTSTPDLDLSAVIFQLGGNATNLGPSDQAFPWSGGSTSSSISESFIFPEPINVSGLYAWVGNAWSAGTGRWNGSIALDGLGQQTGLISALDPASGTLGPGESIVVDALIESGTRSPGTYEEVLILLTDQPDQAELGIPVQLTVPGEAELGPLPVVLDFAEVVVGATASLSLLIENVGNLALEIDAIATDNPTFTVSASELNLAPGESADLVVRFEPDASGAFDGVLSFATNDVNAQQVVIDLNGVGLPAPKISIDPNQASLTLASEAQGNVSFTISNEGDSPLAFSLPQFAGDAATVTRMTPPVAIPGLPAERIRQRLAANMDARGADSVWESIAQPASPEIGYPLEFSNFAASAGEFVLVDGPLSGELTLVVADFILDSASGQTWASDLTLLIATTPTPDLDGGEDVLIQLGGSVGTLAPLVGRWDSGGSGAPGTPVQTAIIATEPIVLEDVYLLLGNSNFDGSGQWSGVIDVVDLALTSGPIVGATPTDGTLEPGESATVTLDISAAGLTQGQYLGGLQIASNDPAQDSTLFELTLNVTGTPALELGATAVDFGELFIGQQTERELEVFNTGTAPLTLSSFSVDDPAFTVAIESATVEVGASVQVPLSFTAGAVGPASASLDFQTNDPANPTVTLPLTAQVLESPALVIDPLEIEAALAAGADGNVSLTLSNPGSAALTFEFPDFSAEPEGLPRAAPGPGAHRSVRLATPTLDQALSAREAYQGATAPAAAGATESAAEFLLEFQGFIADGMQFTQVATGLSGSLERIDADFVLDQASGLTWASDLAVIITNGPTLEPDAILLQAGGTIALNADAPRLSWQTGNSSAPGTVVQTSLNVNPPLALDDAHVWLGNAWVAGDEGEWTGTIGLDGVNDRVPFIIGLVPSTGEVAPGASVVVDVALSTEGLNAGTYRDRLTVLSNDPIAPARELPATLVVSGDPALDIVPTSLDFGEVFVGANADASVLVSNTGTDLLEVDSVNVSGTGFATSAQGFELAPGASAAIAVSFFSDSAGGFSGELALSSNAYDEPAIVALSAEAREPGILTVSDTSLSIEVPAGGTATAALTLGNIGDAPLAFDAASWQSDTVGSGALDLPSVQIAPTSPIVALAPARTAALPFTTDLQDREVLWEQPPTASFRVTNSRSTELDAGLYAADAFDIDGAALLQGVTAFGFRFDGAQRFDETFDSVVFYVFPDDDGRPAGSPDDGEANHLFRFEASVGSPGFSIEEESQSFGTRADVSLDLVAATGEGLLLGDGRYWLLVHAVSASEDLFDEVWSQQTSFSGAQVAAYIDFDNLFDIGGETWQPLANIIPSHSSNLAFRLEGRALNFLSVNPAQGMIGVDDTQVLELLADASDFEPGSYAVELVIRTDSPATPEAVVTVAMVVTEAETARGLVWVNLAGPPSAEIVVGERVEVHGQARIHPDSLREGQAVQMWVGFHHSDIHPALWPASAWTAGELLAQDGDLVSFNALAGEHLTPGQYHYATRFRLEDGSYVYGGYHVSGGGFWNGLLHTSGLLTVPPAPQDRIFGDRFSP